MFYDDPACAFRLTGVYYVNRCSIDHSAEQGRQHTAIGYRIKGNSCFLFGKKALSVAAGSVIYIPANLDYIRSSEPEELIIVHLQGFGAIGNEIEAVPGMEKAGPLFRKLLHTWEEKDPGAYNRSMQILYSIFQLLQQAGDRQQLSVPAMLQPGVALLQKRYKDPALRIEDLAEACFISQVYFRKLFQQHFGKSPQKALMELRFDYVCQLLSSGYYTQKEAAQLAGFSDVKYFRTTFKKYFGITPSAYMAKGAAAESIRFL